MRIRRAVSLVVAVALLTSLVSVTIAASPAAAADPGVAELVSTLDGGTNSLQAWSQGLTTVGKLADALPAVQTSAGSVLGFSDLLHQWFTNGAHKVSLATTDGDLNFGSEPISLGDTRSGTLEAHLTTVGSDKQLDLTVTAAKTLHDQGTNIAVPIGTGSSAPQSAFSSQGGVDLSVTGTLSFRLVWDHGSGKVHLVADATTPSIHVDAAALLATASAVHAAIGILGVSLVNDSTLSLAAHFIAGVSDPNNDGKLAFVNDDGSAGELAQPGSLAGLVTFGFASPAGGLHAHLHLNAAATASFTLSLPSVDATIQVDWNDISTGTPTVTPTGVDIAGQFLNLTPRDLADGIAQLATTLTSIQRAHFGTASAPLGNLDLPFLKGSLADAIQLNEAIKKFLKDNTVDAAVDAVRGGQPTFVSLQELLDRLNTATGLPGGASIGISDVHYVDPKIDFKITLHRAAPSSPVDLNAAAAAASGGAGSTYTGTTLSDTSQAWAANAFAGHHVVAGTSGGTVVSNTANTLTLQAPGWTPTTPVAGSPYTISGGQGDIGVAQLGNALQTTGRGVANANAVNATAKVTPSYDASLTLVLDLQAPTQHNPPTEVANPDGSTTLVSSTPIAADRVLLRTTGSPSLFTADFPIDAGIDLFANAGFLQVELKGAAHVCQTNAGGDCTGTPRAGDHMVQVDLKDNGDLTFGQVVDKLLHAPGDLMNFQVHVRGTGSVAASIPGTADFFGGGSATASFTWNDLTKLTGADGPQFDTSGLSKLVNVDFDPSNPKQLFSIILKTLQTLDKAIGDADPSGASVFSQKIPVVGRSLRDLLRSDESGMGTSVTFGAGFVQDTSRSASAGNAFPQSLVGRSIVAGTQVGIIKTVADTKLTMASGWATQPATGTAYIVRSELDDAISILQSSPSDNLQALVRVLNGRLAHDTPISFAYDDGAKVGNVPSLVINLDWKRSFHTSAPVQFDFHLPIGDQKLAGVQGSGLVSLGAGGEIKLGLVVPLAAGDGPADAAALKILDDSSIGVKVNASVVNATIATAIGPLSLSLGDPTSSDKATAKASYSLDLAKSGSTGTAQDFAGFLGAVAPTLNASSDAVDCGFGGATPLALCATLPLYISTDGGVTYSKLIDPGANAFNLRLPKASTPVTNLFDLSGAQVDGHDRLETPDPTQLGNAIASHLIDLTRIDGIDGFLNLLEQSLNAASFGGKLPLVGDDLQQGAEFIGKLKQTIDSALGNLASVDSISKLRDWVNNKLASGLSSAGMNPELVKVDTQCATTLDRAAAPGVTPSPTGGGQTVRYAIASYVKNSSNDVFGAIPGPLGQTTDGPTTIDSGHTGALTWPAVTGAAGYRIYRDDGGALKLLSDAGTATTYTDNGSDTLGAAPLNPAGANPKLTDCPFSDFDSVLIRLDVSQGNFSGDFLSCAGAPAGHKCLSRSVPLNIGIPGLSLRAADPSQGPSVEIGWRLHLAFGISRSDGFFVDTKDGGPQPELALGLNFTLPSEMQAQLAFVNITAKNCDKTMSADCDTAGLPAPGAAPPLFGGTFKIDITSPNPNGRLTLPDLSDASLGKLFDVKLNAGVNIDWLLKAKVGGSEAGFPGIQTELRLKWQWSNAEPGANGTGGGNSPLAINFLKVQIDAGEVFAHVLGPIVNEIKKVTGPLDPIIKTLYAPIPVLSDLSHLVGGDDITMVSIAKAFSTLAGGPDLSFIDTITGVINFINNFPACTTTCLISIGSFSVGGGKALDNAATPSNTQSLISGQSLDPGAGGASGVLGSLDGKDSKGTGSLNGSSAPAAKAGFSFPVFEHPASLFNLILGGDVDLVKFDSGPLNLGFDWRQEFGPVYAPPPVLITLHGSASVTLRIVAGFDTFGIRKAFEAARAGTLDLGGTGETILQSLFFYTVDDQGKPLPVVSFTGELAAGAEVSAVIITVGIEGGVGLTVSFLWNDPNNDGKFRITEFLQTALNNPICLFTVSGRLFVFLKLFVTIGFSPFSVSFDFTIVDVTLLDFSATPNCTPPPPKLGALGDGAKTLVVYAAALGHAAQRGNPNYESDSEDKDTVNITELHDYTSSPPTFKGIGVQMLGITNEFLNTNIERVVVDGRGYAKPMSVTFLGDGKLDTAKTGGKPPTASFDKDAVVFGGNAADVVKTGIGSSFVDGGPGNDIIVTGDRTVLNAAKTDYLVPGAKALVAGGAGDDSITVGNGNDKVAGDGTLNGGGLKSLTDLKELKNSSDPSVNVESGDPTVSRGAISVPNWTTIPQPNSNENHATDGNDIVNVGLGASTLYGNDGNDTLGVGADNPLAMSRPAQAALFTSQGVTLVGGDGSDHFAGGSGNDAIYTAAQTNSGSDDTGPADAKSSLDPPAQATAINIVDTGTGSDTVFGGQAADRVTGHSTPTQVDEIRGGGGDDILVGGFGADKVYGGPGNDYVLAEPSTVDLGSGPPADDGFGPAYAVTHFPLPSNVTPARKTLVGGLGKDHIVGGDGGADVYGDQQTTPCVAGSPVASDPVDESVDTAADGNDRIIGGAGVENVRAGGGDDYVDVKANSDLACGEKGNDNLVGGSEDDQLWGGSGQDTLLGDTGADKLYGNADKDTIYGGDGNDLIEGNTGTDWASGGNDDDVVIGGTRAAGRDDQNDVLYGDNGADNVIGDNGDLVGGAWIPLDLTGLPATAGGGDLIFGGAGNDRAFGGLADDTIYAGAGDDHAEGNNGSDTILGEAGDDELVGGSFQETAPGSGVGRPDGADTVFGGSGNDVITGDNAVVATSVAAAATDTVKGRGFATGHTVQLLDLGYAPTAGTSDGDTLHGDDGNDVAYGQGGNDAITGDANDDYAEGGPGTDTISGNTGQDDLVGGSSTELAASPGVGQPDVADVIGGGDGADVVIGDNGKILRDPAASPSPLTTRPGMATQRSIVLDDLGLTPRAASSGADLVTGDNDNDVILGQGGDDRLKGNAGDDYVEGDQGSDAIEGDTGEDDLVGGSSTVLSGSGDATQGQADTADQVSGGPGDDVITGDNALVLRTGARASTTNRVGTSSPGNVLALRNITLFDLNGPAYLSPGPADRFGDDRLSGGSGVDIAYGQDGNDQVSGGPDGDYVEGNGGDDILRGDVRLDQPPTTADAAATTLLATVWPGSPSPLADQEGTGVDGQDDLIGGSSRPAFRDGKDNLEGDGGTDFQLGDNGTLKRDVLGAPGSMSERRFVQRYADTAALPADAAVVRIHDAATATLANSGNTTRFCTTAQATCEVAGAFGSDTMFGDSGDDTMWGQDGNDTLRGGAGNDDMYGELGDDVLYGEDGKDGILGDRGGVVDELMNPSDIGKQFVDSTNNPPKETFTGLRQGTLDHRVDLLHDIDGDVFVGTSTSAPMAHAGLNEGGNDRIRGGNDADNIHAGYGEDLANGDSGGDAVFGDDGADVLWGGKGCDAALDTLATSPDCFAGAVFDPNARGTDDRFVDHLFGGVGGPTGGGKSEAGSDILDWRPRGTYTPGTGCPTNSFPVTIGTSNLDPCSWFEMTSTDDDTAAPASLADNQHHQGTDWMYGGWDRDVLQADVAANGPNPGDRLLDWNGAYNLYSHCNAAYGGFNDVRQHSPDMQHFLQLLSYADGAGQLKTDSAARGTSAFRELALVYPADNNAHGSGPAYPTTPGHFDTPSCAD